MKNFTSYLKKAFGITLVLIVLCGVVYPLVMTGAGQLLFKKQANGSMIEILQLWKHDGRTSDTRGKRYESISKEV